MQWVAPPSAGDAPAYNTIKYVYKTFTFPIPSSQVNRQRFEEAETVLRRAARMNGTAASLPKAMHLDALGDQHSRISHGICQELMTLANKAWVLVVTPGMRRTTFALLFIVFNNSVIYFGLSFYSVEIGGSAYVNFWISGMIEWPVIPLMLLLCALCKRRPSVGGCMLGAGVALAVVASLDAWQVHVDSKYIVALATAGKLLITISFNMILVIA